MALQKVNGTRSWVYDDRLVPRRLWRESTTQPENFVNVYKYSALVVEQSGGCFTCTSPSIDLMPKRAPEVSHCGHFTYVTKVRRPILTPQLCTNYRSHTHRRLTQRRRNGNNIRSYILHIYPIIRLTGKRKRLCETPSPMPMRDTEVPRIWKRAITNCWCPQ